MSTYNRQNPIQGVKESCSNRKQFSKTLCRFLLHKCDKDVRIEKDFKDVGTVEEIIG